jgi:hypothetical protein
MGIEFVWGNHYAGPGLLNLIATGGVQANEEYIPTMDDLCHHHSHSFPSKWVGVGGSSKRSSPFTGSTSFSMG